jgi:hypothetical protein
VELGHPNEAETATDQERFLGRIAGAFPEAALETEGDRTVVFISRPGHLLPEPSRPVASASEDEEAATEVE